MISIVIPVYNSECYLVECLDSVLSQTFVDFEVLLINDGSTDNSGEICERYVKKDTRFKVFHQKNSGVSAARNVGIENAKGEWITFVDSDDYIEENFLHCFFKTQNNCQLVMQGARKVKRKEVSLFFSYNNCVYTLEEILRKYEMFPYFSMPWSKMFRSDILKKYNLRFDKCLTWGEDTLFVVSYLKYCERIKTVSSINYSYRDDVQGLSNKKIPIIFYLELIEKLKGEFLLVENKIGYLKDKDNYSVIMGRLLSIIYTTPDDRQRLAELNSVYKTNKEELISVFARAKGLGKICYILLKFGYMKLFDKFYGKLL